MKTILLAVGAAALFAGCTTWDEDYRGRPATEAGIESGSDMNTMGEDLPYRTGPGLRNTDREVPVRRGPGQLQEAPLEEPTR
jgi:hypothetical protein